MDFAHQQIKTHYWIFSIERKRSSGKRFSDNRKGKYWFIYVFLVIVSTPAEHTDKVLVQYMDLHAHASPFHAFWDFYQNMLCK